MSVLERLLQAALGRVQRLDAKCWYLLSSVPKRTVCWRQSYRMKDAHSCDFFWPVTFVLHLFYFQFGYRLQKFCHFKVKPIWVFVNYVVDCMAAISVSCYVLWTQPYLCTWHSTFLLLFVLDSPQRWLDRLHCLSDWAAQISTVWPGALIAAHWYWNFGKRKTESVWNYRCEKYNLVAHEATVT